MHRRGYSFATIAPDMPLPTSPAPEGLVAAPTGAAAPAPGWDILVVEDNVVNQQVAGHMLRELAFRAHLASGAMEGLRALCEKRFDLVLMDIEMRGMDGIAALRWFRRGPAERFNFVTPPATPVIAATANGRGDDAAHWRALGFDDYLPKPFRLGQLLSMLSRHLSLHAPVRRSDAALPGAAPAASAEVFDAAALARLRELDPSGDNGLMQRVLHAFQTSTARLLPQLREASRAGDLAGVHHVAHTLKSSSASIGAMHLAHICTELEATLRTDPADSLGAHVDAMCAEVAIVLKALEMMLDDKG